MNISMECFVWTDVTPLGGYSEVVLLDCIIHLCFVLHGTAVLLFKMAVLLYISTTSIQVSYFFTFLTFVSTCILIINMLLFLCLCTCTCEGSHACVCLCRVCSYVWVHVPLCVYGVYSCVWIHVPVYVCMYGVCSCVGMCVCVGRPEGVLLGVCHPIY